MPTTSFLLLPAVLALTIQYVRTEEKFCPVGTAVIANQPGCQVCLCCRYAQSDEFLVRCDHAELNAPPPLPVNTTELWLYGNNISRIHTFQHLPSLSTLKLSDCRTSESLRQRADCVEEAVVLSDQALINLPSLQYLHIYVNSHDQLQFLHTGININELVIACQAHLPDFVQRSFSKFNIQKLVSFGCGLHLDQEKLNVTHLRIMDDSSTTKIVNLPNTDVELSVKRLDSSDCMSFTKLRVKSLVLICTTQVFNITDEMFGNLTEVGKLNLTIEATRSGYVNTIRVPPIYIHSLYFNFHFYDRNFYKTVNYVLRKVHVQNFRVKTNSPARIDSNYIVSDAVRMLHKWPALKKILRFKSLGDILKVANKRIWKTISDIYSTNLKEGQPLNINDVIHQLGDKLRNDIRDYVSGAMSRTKRSLHLGHIFKHLGEKVKHEAEHLKNVTKTAVEKILKNGVKHLEKLAKTETEEKLKKGLRHLEEKVKTKGIKYIGKLATTGLRHFLRRGRHEIEHFGNYVDELWGPYLATQPVSRLTTFECDSCIMKVSLDDAPVTESLRKITIRSNGKSQILMTLGKWLKKAPSLDTLILTSLEYLDIRFDFTMEHENLAHLDLSDAQAVQTAGLTHTDFNKLPNLRSLKLDKTFRNISVCSFHRDYDLKPHEICFSFSALRKLEVLTFSENNARFLGSLADILSGLIKLNELNLGGNQLNEVQENGLKTLLAPVADTLKLLDLSRNGITAILPDTFSRFRRLQSLNLKGNHLQVVSVDLLKDSSFISHLDMGSNQLKTIDPDLIASKPYLRFFDVSSNAFHCDCSLRSFRDWVNGHKTTIRMNTTHERCYNPDTSTYNDHLLTMYTMAWIACDNHWIIVQSLIVVGSVALVTCLSYTVYYYRYDLVYLWFLRKRRLNHYELLENDDDEFDAFLSYCQVDDDIALDIHHRLENDQDAEFRVAIHDRDFTPGWYISENIAHYVKHSRKFIPLISRRYLQSEWAQYELEMAKYRSFKQKRNMLIPVFIEKIPKNELPDSLKALIRRITYLEWPNETQRERDVFFKRLKMNLGWDKPQHNETTTAV